MLIFFAKRNREQIRGFRKLIAPFAGNQVFWLSPAFRQDITPRWKECRTLRLLLAFAVTLVIGVDATNAQDTSKKSPGRQRRSAEEIFNKLDTNKDGKLSKEEFMKDVPEARKEAREKRFTAIDTNKDGTVTKEELKAAFEKTRDRQEKDGKRGK